MGDTKMHIVPGKVYYLEQGEQIAVPTISSSPNITDFGVLAKDLGDSGFYLRHWELSYSPDDLPTVTLDIATTYADSGHINQIMAILAKYSMHIKEIQYRTEPETYTKQSGYMYYNIMAYIGNSLIDMPTKPAHDIYDDELENPVF